MPFVAPELIPPDDQHKKIAIKMGLTMRNFTWVFEELRDGFWPRTSMYHTGTTASNVQAGHQNIGCRVLRFWHNPKTGIRAVVGQQGIIQEVSKDGTQARVLLQGARSTAATGTLVYTPDIVPVGILRRGNKPSGEWTTELELLVPTSRTMDTAS
jgi:hypothetical protein